MTKKYWLFIFLNFVVILPLIAQNWKWAHYAGGTDDEEGNCVTTDDFGNVFVTGEFQSTTALFGGITLINTGSNDFFIAKYDSSGNIMWAKSAVGTQGDFGISCKADKFGNVYVVGYTWSTTISFGNFSFTNMQNTASDLFIVKYDSSGNELWAKRTGGNHFDEAYGVTLDTSGNVYVTGYFSSDSITFDNFTFANANQFNADMFIVKYDTSGNVLWAKTAGDNGHDWGYGITADKYGYIYVTGSFTDSITFDSILLKNTNPDYNDIYVTKFAPGGNVLWARSAGGPYYDDGRSIATGSDGSVYLTGDFRSADITFDTIVLNNVTPLTSEVFLAKYDSAGQMIWARNATGTWDDIAYSVAVDSLDNIYLTGFFNSPTFSFGSLYMFNLNSYSGTFFVKYSSSGNALWLTQPSGAIYGSNGNGVTIDRFGNMYTTGYYGNDNITFGNITLNYYWLGDIFLAKLGLNVTGISNPVYLDNNTAGVFPNPFSEQLIISSGVDEPAAIILYEIDSRELLKLNFTKKISINTGQLSKGIYIYEIRSKNGVIKTGKVMKQ